MGEEDDELERMLEELMRSQLRVVYRRSLGREYSRRSLDEEIRRIFKKRKGARKE